MKTPKSTPVAEGAIAKAPTPLPAATSKPTSVPKAKANPISRLGHYAHPPKKKSK